MELELKIEICHKMPHHYRRITQTILKVIQDLIERNKSLGCKVQESWIMFTIVKGLNQLIGRMIERIEDTMFGL